jgi:transposase
MKHLNTVGVDLAKNIIQVSVVSSFGKEQMNRSLTRTKFAEFLGKQKTSLVAFEACATAHYWARVAKRHGHEVKIIPARAVLPFRQGHKTDPNDALAVAEAAVRPRGLLLEFGVVIPQGFAALHRQVPEILEDGENELPDIYRPTLHRLYVRLCDLREDLGFLDKQIDELVKQHPSCERLMAMEGVGPISSILLFATLGTGEAFRNGRQFSAYLGLTPKQYSSGGKTNLVGISKKVANKRLRSVLIQGARAYVHKMKEPRTPKDQWLWQLIQRAGHGKAAVALANKNVRTAWALLTEGTEYDRQRGRMKTA